MKLASITVMDDQENRLDLDAIQPAGRQPSLLLHAIQRRTQDEHANMVTMSVDPDQAATIAGRFLIATGHTPKPMAVPDTWTARDLEDAAMYLLGVAANIHAGAPLLARTMEA